MGKLSSYIQVTGLSGTNAIPLFNSGINNYWIAASSFQSGIFPSFVSGYSLKNDGSILVWASSNPSIPIQAGHSGQSLVTDGSNLAWLGITGIPTPLTSGFFVTNNGTVASWSGVLPNQSGQSGNILFTNGTGSLWGSTSSFAFANPSGHSGQFLSNNGTTTSWVGITGLPTPFTANQVVTNNGTTASWSGVTGVLNPGTSTGIYFTSGTNFSWQASTSGQSGKMLYTDGSGIQWGSNPVANVSGNSGSVLYTDGITTLWSGVIPTQSGNSGNFLVTNGTGLLWSDYAIPFGYGWNFPSGVISGSGPAVSAGAALYVLTPAKIVACAAYAKTPPSGNPMVFDINVNGSTIWSTQSNRIQVSGLANSGTQSSFNTTLLSRGDVLTIDLDQAGSGTFGGDVVVELLTLCKAYGY